MAAQPAQRLRMTPEEYFAWEETQQVRHEYYHGEVFPMGDLKSTPEAMAGGTYGHARLTGNVIAALGAVLRGSDCNVISGDLRVQLADSIHYAYPDAAVICGPPQFLTERETTLLNPTVLVEVLSPSTEAYDRGAKFHAYRRIASLQEYVLVVQGARRVEVFQREGEGWVLLTFEGDEAELASLGVRLLLDEVYQGVELEPGR